MLWRDSSRRIHCFFPKKKSKKKRPKNLGRDTVDGSEILYQLKGILSQFFRAGFIHPKWCTIFQPNNSIYFGGFIGLHKHLPSNSPPQKNEFQNTVILFPLKQKVRPENQAVCPKRESSSSNHQFSGAFVVSFMEGKAVSFTQRHDEYWIFPRRELNMSCLGTLL